MNTGLVKLMFYKYLVLFCFLQYTFKQEPKLDQYGQRPVPANIL